MAHRRTHPPHRRWQRWQASPQVQRVLTPEQQQHGLTVLRVHPVCREAFLEVVGLLKAYSQLTDVTPAMRQAWAQWLDHTGLLRAQCTQEAHHHQGVSV